VQALLERGADEAVEPALRACLTLARFVRTRGSVGPGLVARAVDGVRRHGGRERRLPRDTTVDLFVELLEKDVQAVDLIDAFVCATSQLLVHVDPHGDESLRRVQVAELLGAVPDGARGARWLLVTCLREAPEHDTSAADLTHCSPRAGARRRPARDPSRASRGHRRGAALPRRVRRGVRRRGADAARGAAGQRPAERAAGARAAAGGARADRRRAVLTRPGLARASLMA
jgi:hypothetical protein